MFIPFYSLKTISPIQWLVSAKEYLGAVKTLSFLDAENAMQVKQDAPILTLLAYAYEQILKSSSQLHRGKYDQTHNLNELWKLTDKLIVEKVPTWKKQYVESNRNGLSEDELDAVLQIDQNFGQPNGSFEQNLGILNNWTWRSIGPEIDDRKTSTDDRAFLSRYPQVGLMQDGIVDVRFLHEIGHQIIGFEHQNAMDSQKENFE